MKDLFYTILVVWILWRLFNGISSYKAGKVGKDAARTAPEKEPGMSARQRMSNNEGEYVDYEEIK